MLKNGYDILNLTIKKFKHCKKHKIIDEYCNDCWKENFKDKYKHKHKKLGKKRKRKVG